MSNYIVKIETLNKHGRDFIVGDLHGCVKSLMEGLEKVLFEPTVDRVFCLGDLIDRGPDSFNTLRLLKEPWFFSLRGNHEDMLLSALYRFDSILHRPSDFYRNGGEWVANLEESKGIEFLELVALIEKLPYVRTFVDDLGEVVCHLAHAELLTVAASLSGSSINSTDFISDSELLRWGTLGEAPEGLDVSRFKAISTWGRRVFGDFKLDAFDVQNIQLPKGVGLVKGGVDVSENPYATDLSLSLVGHSVVKNPVLHFSHLFIDGGVVRSELGVGEGQLILLDLSKVTQWAKESFDRP